MPDTPHTAHIRRNPPPPLPNDGVRTVLVGTVLWAVALVVSLPFAGRLNDHGHLWWIATCAVGAGLGLVGLVYCKRRSDRLRRSGVNPGTEA
jgi:hypothetical protein